MTADRDAPLVGVGLWAMRSTIYAPKSWTALYRGLREDAVLAERLGFDSLWLAEHHGWYDGWCPQLWVAASSALAVTERLHLGSAMYLLPQHDITQTTRDLGTLHRAFGARVEVGVGLGYRDEEFDVVGVPRSSRGRRMDEALDALARGVTGPGRPGPSLWVGGFSPAAIQRAARRGLSLLLPNTMRPHEIEASRQLLAEASVTAGQPMGRVGVLVDIWPAEDGVPGNDSARARDRIVRYQREYAGAFFVADGEPLFEHPQALDRQSERVRRSAAVGTPDELAERLLGLRQAGADMFVLNVRFDFPDDAHRRAMAVLADEVVPVLRGARASAAAAP
jgi:alkanesulfonate monooxygenase SsuD/methylene tetrahydromethanopterin reductase-like flavin-dependent oxidoreductase (luciferase family)